MCVDLPKKDEFVTGKIILSAKWGTESLGEVEFKDVVFENCAFVKSVFSDCHFDSCEFINCNFEMAKFPGSNFSTVEFVKCRLRGILWDEVGLSFHDILFRDSDLDYSSFFGRRLDKEVVFANCSLKEVGFEQTSLKDGKITNCDLLDARFADADLIRTDFSQSRNYSIDIGSSKVKKPIFTLPEALCLFEQFDIVVR